MNLCIFSGLTFVKCTFFGVCVNKSWTPYHPCFKVPFFAVVTFFFQNVTIIHLLRKS